MRTNHGHAGQGRILVADWNRTNARTLSAIMDRTGYEVATDFDGEEAVVKSAEFTPDLFIAEPFMGRLSGIEAATAITVVLPACRVLFLSGDASSSDISKAAPKHLAYSFVPKPVPPLDLLNAVAYMLPLKNSFGDPAAMSALDDSIDLRWAIEISSTTRPCVRRPVSAAAFG
jgi:two-component system response regulator VicR